MGSSDSKSLVKRRLSHLLDVAGITAKLASIGLSGPAGMVLDAAVTAAQAATKFAEQAEEAKRQEQLRRVLESLSERVASLEPKPAPPVDVFLELLLNASRQDDERKVHFQSAVIAWFLEKRPDPSLARMAISAVANLSYLELRAFASWHARGCGDLRFDRGVSRPVMIVRWHQAGLIEGTNLLGKPFVTELGRLLAEGGSEDIHSDREWEILDR